MLNQILNIGGTLIDRLIPDKQEQARAKLELMRLAQEGELKELEQQASIIIAEASGNSWLQRNWRPLVMVNFALLITAHWLGFTPPNLPGEQVERLLMIVQVGLGGYVIGRSAEKCVKAYKG